MFERFTDRARQVVVLAQEEARALGHDSIGTEHLLLGLLREEEGIAARVLHSLGVTLDDARADVARLVGSGDEPLPATGQVPFTAHAKKVIELALREALALGHNSIGTEHLLLGLARADEGVAMDVLREREIDAERLREGVVALLAGAPQPAPVPRRARRWRYRVEPLGALDDAAALAPLGAAGWELVAVVGEAGAYRGVFKRPP